MSDCFSITLYNPIYYLLTFNLNNHVRISTANIPVEYLLASLGSCQVITYQVVASLKGIQLNNVKVETKGNIDWRGFLGIDENVRPGYHKIEVETIIDSDESPERIQELIKEVEARCPVLDNLVNTVKVESQISIVNEKNPVV